MGRAVHVLWFNRQASAGRLWPAHVPKLLRAIPCCCRSDHASSPVPAQQRSEDVAPTTPTLSPDRASAAGVRFLCLPCSFARTDRQARLQHWWLTYDGCRPPTCRSGHPCTQREPQVATGPGPKATQLSSGMAYPACSPGVALRGLRDLTSHRLRQPSLKALTQASLAGCTWRRRRQPRRCLR